jgi:hypothetical protein
MLVALEHYVLEEMGKAATAIWIILRTDVIPDLDSDNWGGVIFDAINFEAIHQCGMFEVQRRDRDRLVGNGTLRTQKRTTEQNKDRGDREFHEARYPSEVLALREQIRRSVTGYRAERALVDRRSHS